MPRRSMTAREVCAVLTSNGFIHVSQRGSHRKFFNASSRRTVIVPMHGGTLKAGTLAAIRRAAGLPDEAWE